jgi:hypothetical protein
MDGLEITRSPPAAAPAIGGAQSAASAPCCAPASPAGITGGGLRSWISDRRVLAVAGLAVIGGGLAVGWDWLAAVGVAPLIVSAAPCLIMCALGLCMMGRGRQASSNPPVTGAAEPPARAETDSSP